MTINRVRFMTGVATATMKTTRPLLTVTALTSVQSMPKGGSLSHRSSFSAMARPRQFMPRMAASHHHTSTPVVGQWMGDSIAAQAHRDAGRVTLRAAITSKQSAESRTGGMSCLFSERSAQSVC